jgi:tetratricopeptide (TPR) repeat protein
MALLALACFAEMRAFAEGEDWRSLIVRANVLQHEGKFRESVDPYRSAIKILEGLGSDALQLASALNSLAMTYDDLGQLENAEHYYGRALKAAEGAAGAHSVSRAQVLVNLSCVYIHRGQYAKAEKIQREAIAIYSDLVPSDNLPLGVAWTCLAQALLGEGSFEEAASTVDQAIETFEKEPINQSLLCMSLNTKGAVRWAQGRKEEALGLFERAVGTFDQRSEDLMLLYPLNNLAAAKQKAGQNGEAAKVLHRAVLLAENKLGTNHPLCGQLLMNYADSLKSAGRKNEAKKTKARAEAILKESGVATGSGLKVDVSALRMK